MFRQYQLLMCVSPYFWIPATLLCQGIFLQPELKVHISVSQVRRQIEMVVTLNNLIP